MSACTACGHDNAQGAKFCVECGVPMARSCPTCGSSVTVSQKFCGECGLDLREAPAPSTPAPAPAPTPMGAVASERKQVTVLFADLAGSMDLAEQFDPDEWTQIITGLFETGAEAVRRYGGTIDKFTGDGLMALFGAPIAQEDHAARAAHAALALVEAAEQYAGKVATEHGVDLHVRVGLNSGEVVAGDVGESGFTAVGHTVGLAQRMESLADADTVRLSEHTARLLGSGFYLRDLGAVTIKGATAPMHTFALDAVSAGPRRRSGTARLVGRDAEWTALLAALEAADSGQGQVVGIVGEAGAGKSRLTEELGNLATERGLLVRRTAGVSHATTAPLLPIRALLAEYFGVTDTDSAADVRAKVGGRVLEMDPGQDSELPLIFDFLDVPDPDRPAAALGPEARRRRVLEVFRRITRRRSSQIGLVFLMEDLHWFDEQSVRFLDEWLPSFLGTRTLIVTNFRPEFRAPWVSRSYYRQIPLPALDTAAVRAMLSDLVGPDASLDALREELAERSGGNPFFVEEIVRGWAEDGTLEGPVGAYVLGRPVEAIRIPSTVQSVLADRIDRLGARNKAVLQAAAVIGRTFSVPVLQAVTGLTDELDTTLTELCTAELLQETDEQEYRFWHPLTQEVAYHSLLGATRRQHHRAVAEALLASGQDRQDEIAALIASHYEAADDYLEAGRWQIRAAHRASRTDVQDSRRRLRTAIAHFGRLPTDDEALALSVRARTLLLRVGSRAGMDPAEAEAHVEEARQVAERLGDPVLFTHLTFATGIYRLFTGNHAGALASFHEADAFVEQTDDRDLEAWTLSAGTAAYAAAGPLDAGLAKARRGIELCGGDPTVGYPHAGYAVTDTMSFLQASVQIGAGLLDQARAGLMTAVQAYRIRPVHDWQVWSWSLLACLADATGLDSDTDLARAVLDDSYRIADDLGSPLAKVRTCQAGAIVALLDGRPADAETSLARGLSLARTHHSGLVEEASMLVNLSRAHLALGAVAPARAAAQEAVTTARRQGARVVEAVAHLAHARVLRSSAGGDANLTAAREAVAQGLRLAAATDARTWAAFLAEEQARLYGGDFSAVAAGYDAIGATGHAARIRAELAAV